MTSPYPSPTPAPHVAVPQAAPTGPDPLDALAGAVSGNKALVAHPNVVAALVAGNATSAEVSSANQFVSGLQAQKMVAQLRAAGQSVVFSDSQKAAMDAAHVYYGDVQMTAGSPQQKQQADAITAAGGVPVYDSNGLVIGSRAKTTTESNATKSGHGWFGSPSDFFHHLIHNPTTDVIGESYNIVKAETSSGGSSNGNAGLVVDHNTGQISNATYSNTDENKILMKSLGYDPNSEISRLAFESKGFARSNLQSVVTQYGQDKVTQAEQYLADPKKYTEDMLSTASDATDQAAKMAQLNSPEFGKLLKELAGRDASVGADVALGVGLDPVKNSSAYAWTSGGVNFVTSFMTDPTIVLGKFAQGVKIAQIGIDGLTDIPRIAKILNPANKDHYAQQVQRGFSSAVDSGNLIREGQAAQAAAHDAEDLHAYTVASEKVASGYRQLQAVGLQELAPALVGSARMPAIGEKALGEGGVFKTVAGGEPLNTYDKLFDYVTNTYGLLALKNGKAMVESSLMPGAMSAFGATKWRMALASTMSGRKTTFEFNKANAARFLPTAIDAVGADGAKIAETVDESTAAGKAAMASEQRGANAFPTAAQQGEVEYNLRRYGNYDGTGIGGVLGKSLGTIFGKEITPGSWINPRAIAARAKVAATRLNVTNVLPRNNLLTLADEQAPAQIEAFARLYLPRQQAAMLAATYATGDYGTRRAIFQGMKAQVFHAAGFGHSEAGREIIDKFASEDAQIYSHSVDGVMSFDPWTHNKDVPTAIWNSQMRDTYSIPSFATLHATAAKTGFYEATLGRAFTSKIADAVTSKLRYGMLATPRTAVRAAVEGLWVNALARGDFRRAFAAKATLHDVDGLPPRWWLSDKFAHLPVVSNVGQWIRAAEKRGMTPEENEFISNYLKANPEMAKQIQETIGDHILTSDVNPIASSHDAMDIARAGMTPVKYEKSEWEARSTAGWEGAQRLEAALALRQHGNPESFKALLAHIEDPSEENLRLVQDALKSSGEYEKYRTGRWANTYLDGSGIPQRALTDGEKEIALGQHVARMRNDLASLVTGQDGEINQKLLNRMADHVPDPGKVAALEAWVADHQAAFDALGRRPKGGDALKDYDQAEVWLSDAKERLATETTTGTNVPDATWIHQNLDDENRPLSAIAPSFVPAAGIDPKTGIAGAMQTLGDAFNDVTGQFYKFAVERPAQRWASMPVFWQNFARARSEMRSTGFEDAMLAAYDNPETVERLLGEQAIRQAWQRTEMTIDDPGLKAQFDIVGRNFVGFPRAINAFLRRYSQLVKQDPTVLRKAVLTIEGAQNTGLIYKDENGELTYTLPGSGFLLNSLNEFGRMMGYEKFLTLPSADITGKLLKSAPGFDNPIRPSLSPMANIPFRWFGNMFPDHREMIAEIDSVLNGSQGAGRSTSQQLMPALFSHFYEALDPHEQNNLLASATIGAFANIVAADPNGEKGILPPPGSDPTGAKMQALMATLKTQVRNQLFGRAVTGLFLPSAPSRPSDNTAGSHPDEAYFIRGARTMSTEFKMMVEDFKGDYAAATVAFVALHPNGLVYTMPTSTVGSPKANIPATRESEQWMEKNYSLIEKYPAVAAYFAPTSKGNFDANAWQSQLALGLRNKMSIDEFVKNYQLKVSQATYFQAYDTMKTAADAATKAGNTTQSTFLKANFKEQMAPFLASNPILNEWLTLGSSEKQQQAANGIQQLRVLVDDPKSKSLVNIDGARLMIQAYDVHKTYQNNTLQNSSTARSTERDAFAKHLVDIVNAQPDLAGLYDMFQAIDFNSLPSLASIVTTPGS